jgi:hypothetical protein
LYIYYNSDLLDIPKEKKLGLGFADDIGYGASGSTAQEIVKQLQEMLGRAEAWRTQQETQFEKSKYVLINFYQKSQNIN